MEYVFCTLCKLNNDFFSDNVPTVLLASWPLDVNMWDGEILAGPVPTLFSEDTKASEDGLRNDPNKAHADMRKLARVFFMPEHMGRTAAEALIRKPR